LINKGVLDFVSAAEMVQSKYSEFVRFVLVGPFESGSGGVCRDELARWQRKGVIDYRGAIDDVREVIAESSVYVLPSYREGTPRTVLEAMSMGRPVITTDVPGCRDTVVDGENGYLVPVRDPVALAGAMERFISNPNLISEMGQRGRELAKKKYDVKKVNAVILAELGL
jgi:glycosyltransferase involved in cell wall biosynthesis